MENPLSAPKTPEKRPYIFDDIEDAREYVREKWAEGVRPIVTAPMQYMPALEQGLKPHTTWIPGFDAIAGTFDRDPYMPKGGEERVSLKINVPPEQIEPRFTGPDKKFSGVIILKGPIPPEAIEVLH